MQDLFDLFNFQDTRGRRASNKDFEYDYQSVMMMRHMDLPRLFV